MLKKILFFLFSSLAALSFGGGATSAQNSALTLVCFDFPPFMERPDGGLPKGMMVDVVEEAFSRMGRQVKIEFYPLARDFMMLDSSLADGLFLVKKTPERESKLFFPSEALAELDYVVFVRSNSVIKFEGNINSLVNYSIGIVDKASYGLPFDQAIAKKIFKKLEMARSNEANFRKLIAGRMDVVISSRVVGLSILKRLNAANLVMMSGPPIEVVPTYLAFNKKTVDPGVVIEFDNAISQMRKDKTLKKIVEKYTPQGDL